jgi:putative DNA primase/helicase
MLILEGDQGGLKSSALESLVPKPDLFTDDLGEALGKEAAERIAGKWLIEVAELDAMSRAEVTRTKSFITRRVDRFRPSYGRWALDCPRQCVFAGTTNADIYLKDETGGRR